MSIGEELIRELQADPDLAERLSRAVNDGKIRGEARAVEAASPFRPGVQYLTATQVSKILHRSVRSIHRDRKAGMPAYLVGQTYHYALDEMQAWYEEHGG